MRSASRFVGVLCSLLVGCLAVLFSGSAGGQSHAAPATQESPAVRVWSETKVLPTYPVGRPSDFPDLSKPSGMQTNPRPGLDLYPYTAQRELSFDKRDVSYHAYVLQNEYLRIEVLPDLGGRMFSMYDRVTGQDVVYRQESIKPALVALRGAWISGGIEWDFPRSHSVTTFDTVSCQTQTYPDGSASIIVGDTERIWHMSWTVELLLRPGRAQVETRIICRNPTPFAHDGYWWSNAGIPANDQLQFIYPFNKITGHEASGATDWPIQDGKDMSWYKDYPGSTSTFRAAGNEDFIVGYDHGRDLGLAQYADHNVMPGRKWFSWGTGESGQRWAKILSDDNRPYVEIQSGCPLTQSQQFTMPPHEERQFLEYWMPVTRIGPPARVNPDAAVGLTVDKDVATVGVLPTHAIGAARIELLAGQRVLKQWRADISPKDVFKDTCPLGGADPDSLRLAVFDASGKEVIAHHYGHYTPGPTLVEAGSRPSRPAGSRPGTQPGERPSFQPAEQAGATSRPTERPVDPELARLNAAIAQIGLNQYAAAKETLAAMDGSKVIPAEALLYYRALADARLNHTAEALGQWEAIKAPGPWRDAAMVESAKLLLAGGKWDEAITVLTPLADRTPCDAEAAAYTALAWRQLKQPEKARASLKAALQRDPLSLLSQTEQALVEGKDFSSLSALRDEERRIEDATIYMAIKQYDTALALLTPVAKTAPSATASYLNAYVAELMGDTAAAARLRGQAAGATVRGCMPARSEELAALEAALRANDKDASAHYLAGLMLTSRGRKDDGIAHWRQAVALGHDDAVVYCCLGDALRDQDPQEAAKLYERAGQLAPNAPEIYADLDFAYAQLGQPAKRVEVLERGLKQLPARDDLAQRLGVAYFDAGRFDDAIGCYRGHRFHISEGQRDLHDNYAIALVGRAMTKLAAGQNQEALTDLDAALEYPENMGVGRPERGGNSPTIQYWRGVALGRLGQTDASAKAWQEAANPTRSAYMGMRMGMGIDYGLQTVHTVLALRTLGKNSQADDLARQVIEGSRRMEGFDPPNGKVNALILRGYLAAINGQADEAAKLLEQAQATPSKSAEYVRLVRAWMDLAQPSATTQPAAK